jgi:hypothetical protein
VSRHERRAADSTAALALVEDWLRGADTAVLDDLDEYLEGVAAGICAADLVVIFELIRRRSTWRQPV